MSSRSDRHNESRKALAQGRREGTKRDWSTAIEKRDLEGICRLAQHDPDLECDGMLEAAHTVGRKWDDEHWTKPGWLWVNPNAVVPLCQRHHRLYDAHVLDLLPFMSLDEQADAVRRVGIIRALARLSGGSEPRASGAPRVKETDA